MTDSTATSAAPPLPASLNVKLSTMMFLQYGIWGAWLPILFPFLMGHFGWEPSAVGWIFSVGAVGAVIGPFIAGQLADRHLSTEKMLAGCHLIGAGLMWVLASSQGYWEWFAISLVYGAVYAPTLALTNSLAFAHLPDRDRDFGRIRVWGTIGWIVAGLAMGWWLLVVHTPEGSAEVIKAAQDAGRVDAFYLATILGAVMGVFCLFLPKTPPAASEESNAAFKAIGEVTRQPLATLFVVSLIVSMIHQFYFVYTADFLSAYGRDTANAINKVLGVGGGGLMTIGQMTEIFVLALFVPYFARRTSRKTLLGIGLVAYAARMALFAYTDNVYTVLAGVALHGFCFGCFIFVAFMIVDEETTPDVRASAQNLYNLVIIGVGVGLGSIVSGYVGDWAQVVTGTDGAGEAILALDYTKLFSVAMWAALACLVALLLFYPGGRRQTAGEASFST